MIDFLLALLILFGSAVILLLVFLFIAFVSSAKDERRTFMSGYFDRKDDNND